jgi:lipoyl synthase
VAVPLVQLTRSPSPSEADTPIPVPVALARKPGWLKVRAPGGPSYTHIKGVMRELGLHTVCEEARCPNVGECWEHKAATFMILGDVCTRNCTYCAVAHGTPKAFDPLEPMRLAEAVERMGLEHVVITSVDRDDLPNGGAEARPGGRYDRALRLLANARAMDPGALTKSGMILGMGEEWDEILVAMRDLRRSDVNILTLGQYLRPSSGHLPVARYYTPDEFAELRELGLGMGFTHVEASPLTRSSYHAWDQAKAAGSRRVAPVREGGMR